MSYAAYKLGNAVVGITNDEEQVRKNQQLFASLGIPSSELCFIPLNLYELPRLEATFDQIICSETLEHIAEDQLILKYFNQALAMDGVLHLCSPFALHPMNALGRVNEPEDGRHVRDGYTLTSYAELLENAGFEIIQTAGLGGPVIVALYRAIGWIRNKLGDLPASPLFLIVLPLFWLDTLNPATPFSLYVKAIKRHSIN